MPPLVIDVRAAEDSRDVVHRAVQALAEGKLVVLPTETVYGVAASALDAEAVSRLATAKRRDPKRPLTLAVKSTDAALDYVPRLTRLGRRLARRCWPGPVTIVASNHHPASLLSQLPASTLQFVAPGDTVGLRVPAHAVVLEILRMVAGPLALSSANRSGEPDAVTAEEALAALGDDVDLVLDDGRSRLAQPSTVVKIGESGLEILRSGVVSAQTLHRLSSMIILFVCTGNTCRSPMAELLCRSMLAKQLGCSQGELADRGVMVMSAGLSASMGSRPSPEAVSVMARINLNLQDHASQPLTPQLVQHADMIFTMTRSHRQAIVSEWPEAASRTMLLCRDDNDVADPIGGPLEQYEACAEQLKTELAARLADIEI